MMTTGKNSIDQWSIAPNSILTETSSRQMSCPREAVGCCRPHLAIAVYLWRDKVSFWIIVNEDTEHEHTFDDLDGAVYCNLLVVPNQTSLCCGVDEGSRDTGKKSLSGGCPTCFCCFLNTEHLLFNITNTHYYKIIIELWYATSIRNR